MWTTLTLKPAGTLLTETPIRDILPQCVHLVDILNYTAFAQQGLPHISPSYYLCFSLVPDAEVMYVVSEVLAELPHPHHWQYSVLVNHVKLTEAILQHCSIPKDRYNDVAALLHKTAVYHCKISVF